MNLQQKILESQKKLKIINKNKKEIFVKAKFGPSKITKIPLHLNEEMAFFIAAIIGDGHLKKSKFQVKIEMSNELIMNDIKKICSDLFKREFNIHKVKERERKAQSYSMCMDSKAIHNLLAHVYEIPIGKKSHLVKISKHIFNSNKSIKSAFLIGIMITDGGRRRRQVGLSTASKQLWKDLIKLFREIGINVLKDTWIYKKYNKEYYGISFKAENLKILMRRCRSGQTGQILLDKFNF